MNAMDAISRNAQSHYENNEAARMRIEDADFAVESAALSQNEILSQAATAVLSQANSSGSMALDLLKNSSE
jgi:flagellin